LSADFKTVKANGSSISTGTPVPADYDEGDGRDDIAVYRPSEGNWYILRSYQKGLQH
jgi:hypothetical protein